MNNIFSRNIGAITEDEQQSLSTKKVFICGCGGLGGYVAEFCTRVGIGNIIVCDKDVFEITNLNRQRFSNIYDIGKSKADVVKEKLLDINPQAKITSKHTEINSGNIKHLIEGCDVVIDALDNIATRKIIEKGAKDVGVPLVFGAVSMWGGQVTTIYPQDDDTIEKLYEKGNEHKNPSVLITTVAITASYQVLEVLKILLHKPTLHKKLLLIDTEENSLDILNI